MAKSDSRPRSQLPQPLEVRNARDKAIRDRYPTEGPERIAAEFGYSVKYIRERAEKMRVRSLVGPLKCSRTRKERLSPVDPGYLDKWSANMAWILGFTWADGCVVRTGNRYWSVNYAVAVKDVEVLTTIKNELQATSRIEYGVDRRTGNKRALLRIRSALLAEKLDAVHGIKPRKTYLDCPFPDIPGEHLSHFVRGCFDGDGCIQVSGHNYFKLDLCGTPLFLSGLNRLLETHLGIEPRTIHRMKGVSRIFWTRRADVYALCRWLYPADQSDYLCLRRKQLLAHQCPETVTRQRRQYNSHGITFHPKTGQWAVYPVFQKRRYSLGYYRTKEEAMIAANVAYRTWYGGAAILNEVDAASVGTTRCREIELAVQEKLSRYQMLF